LANDGDEPDDHICHGLVGVAMFLSTSEDAVDHFAIPENLGSSPK